MAGFWKRVFGDSTPDPETTNVEIPEAAEDRMERRQDRIKPGFGRSLLNLLTGQTLTEEAWEDAEATLLQADLGVATTERMLEGLRKRIRSSSDPRSALRDVLRDELSIDVSRNLDLAEKPSIVMVVGVNGTGKTTTCGKLARLLSAMDHHVVLGAADTFRAAAADQLETWGQRCAATVVRGPENGDPAAVAFETVTKAIELDADVVVIDTAGRLHTKAGLMDELGKVKRVIEKQRPVQEVLLVLDATTGQNGLIQAKVFAEAVNITGVVLTKLDGSAKGGIVFAVQQELGVPVKYVGLGEGPDDLAAFEPEVFVDALLG